MPSTPPPEARWAASASRADGDGLTPSTAACVRYRSGVVSPVIVQRRALTTSTAAPGSASSAESTPATPVCTSGSMPAPASSSVRHAVVAGKSWVSPPESTTARTGHLLADTGDVRYLTTMRASLTGTPRP